MMMQKILDRLNSGEPNRIVFAGDSLTQGALYTFGWRDYAQLFSERLRFELNRLRDIVIKTAASGWTTQQVREDLDWNILQFRPHIVSIMLGMNDCVWGEEGVDRFRDNYNYILDELDKYKTLVLLHTMNPIWESAKADRGAQPSYIQAIRDIAQQRRLPLIDHDAYWQQMREDDPDRCIGWMNDAVHPGERGHRVFAYLMFRELRMWDPRNSRVCMQCIV